LTDGDRDHGVVVRVWVGEEKVELVGAQLSGKRRAFLPELPRELFVAIDELLQLDQVAGAPLQAIPGRDQLAVLRGLSRRLPGPPWVVPRAGLRQLGV
jgi:hypothetical protein